jgi:hypothetical protein
MRRSNSRSAELKEAVNIDKKKGKKNNSQIERGSREGIRNHDKLSYQKA